MDAKATVKVGPFARGGKSRVPTKAADHDFQPAATVTPVGILLPASNELFLYGVTSQVGSRLPGRSVGRLVGERQRALCPHHDPAHQPGQWAGEPQSTYPVHAAPGRVCPALSPHDPSGLFPSLPQQIQSHRTRLRDFGAALEWRLAGFARGRDGSHASTMTCKGKHPVVALVLTPYQTGVKLTRKAMEGIETQRSSIATPGQVVCGHRESLTSSLGELLMLEFLNQCQKACHAEGFS